MWYRYAKINMKTSKIRIYSPSKFGIAFMKPSYLYIGVSCAGKMVSLYWDRYCVGDCLYHTDTSSIFYFYQCSHDSFKFKTSLAGLAAAYLMLTANYNSQNLWSCFKKSNYPLLASLFTTWHGIYLTKHELIETRKKCHHFPDEIFHAFPWMKMCEFRLKFHWILFLRVQLTILQHWFIKWLGETKQRHYLNQWCLVYWCIYFLHSTSVLSFLIGIVLTFSVEQK